MHRKLDRSDAHSASPKAARALLVLISLLAVLAPVAGSAQADDRGNAPAPAATAASTRQILIRRDGLDNGTPFGTASGLLGWEQNSRRYPRDYDVYYEDRAGEIRIINAPYTDGFGGGISGTTIVYSQWDGRFQHLQLYDLKTGQRTGIPALNTPEADYHPTISGSWILFTRGDRTKTTKVLLYNRVSGELRTLASISARGTRAFVYSGQVAGNYAVWGRVTPQGQDVFRYRIDKRTDTLLRRSRGLFARYDPAVTAAGTVYWEQSSNGCRPVVQLAGQPIAGRARVLATIPAGSDGGYMYAVPAGGHVDVLYSRFTYKGCETARTTHGPGALYHIVDRG